MYINTINYENPDFYFIHAFCIFNKYIYNYLMNNYIFIDKYHNIIDTKMKLISKTEALMRLILELDNYHLDVSFRKRMIQKIQKILHVLDNVLL